jgi:tetratricopeptide (TPR) repeat protein
MTPSIRPWIGALLLSAVAPVAALGQRTPAPDPFAACRQQWTLAPDAYDSAFCFFSAALEARAWDRGDREFAALMRAHPENHWLPLAHGHLARNWQPTPDAAAAEARYRASAEGFASTGHEEGEVLARSNLRDLLVPRGRVDDASREVARVVEIGRLSRDPTIRARAWSLEATHLLETGGDLAQSRALLRQAEGAVFPDGPYRLRRTVLASLGIVTFRLGRVEEALDVFRRLDVMAGEERDLQTQASARYNLLNTESLRQSVLPEARARERLLTLAERSLEAGEAARHPIVTLKTHRALAGLLLSAPEQRDAALAHATTCVAMAERTGQRQDEAACAWQQAMLWHQTAPAQAGAAARRAIAATEEARNPLADAQSVGQQMRFSWLTRPRPEAVADSLTALGALESLRALQVTANSSAEAFATWTFDYYWLAGRLLDDAGEEDAAQAFAVVERLRARTLLEARDRTRLPPAADDPVARDRRATLTAIARQQRALMDPAAAPPTRAAHLAELATTEARLLDLDRQLARGRGTPGAGTSFASLADVQAALAPDEAMLSYQLGLWTTADGESGGGAWLTVITRDRHAVHRLPDRAHFAPIVPVFNGLLASGREVAAPAAARLYADVFASALSDLPASITRLVVVPDGPLHNLPFDALRPTAESDPLMTRYETLVTPSATLWLDVRGRVPVAAGTLVLADPQTLGAATVEASSRQAWQDRGVVFGRLPHARREGRAALRHVEDAETLEGAQASEHAIKSRDLGRYGVLHFAAHAVADEAVPERSAVFLAAGDENEDGLLQAREIADLSLRGAVVILSACQTASGAVLSGEGVLSLARAFFQAGAGTVIGTRWPVRDAEAAAFFETFYEVLGEGRSVSEALALTKRRAREAGASPAIWAAVVLLGDGSARPYPRSAPDPRPAVTWVLALTTVALAGSVLVAGRVGRGQRG